MFVKVWTKEEGFTLQGNYLYITIMLEPGKILKNVVKSGTIWHPSVILSLSSTILTFLTTSVTGENPRPQTGMSKGQCTIVQEQNMT